MSDRASTLYSHRHGRNIRPVALKGLTPADVRDLHRIGVALDVRKTAYGMANGLSSAMDALQPLVTTASIPVPIQFLQNWVPGQVKIATWAQKADILMGMSIVGDWHQEEIVQPVLETTGTAVPYQDQANLTYSDWNLNFERRTIVRFEEGMRVGLLEQARAAEVQVDTGSMKREAATNALNIQRNYVAFYGFNSGLGRTYGFLNDPGLPAYVTAATGASGQTTWSRKTFLEITADIQAMASRIQSTTSGDLIDPAKVPCTLAIAPASYQYLSTPAVYGNQTVRQWIKENYPMMRIESAPELNAANGGANVGYLYADNVPAPDKSTDGGMVVDQWVQTVFRTLGVQQLVKGYLEGYSNATAGFICKRPWALTRITGI